MAGKPGVDRLKSWVVTVDMGLGHQRAVYPFWDIAEEGILGVGLYPEEAKLWRNLLRGYEFVSRARKLPIIGKPLFGVLDSFQNIPPFYPIRNMSHPSYQVKLLDRLIDKGMGAGMVEKIASKPLPLLTSYPVPAIAADKAGHPLIYCIVCDAEISRAWVPAQPSTSRIVYLAPCGRAVKRLRSYGVPDERIFLTGFPMPKEATGGPDLPLLKKDVGRRLHALDPEQRFWPLHERNVTHFLGKTNTRPVEPRPVSVTFAVGGAGAQAEIGMTLVEALRELILQNKIILNLVAGVRAEVAERFNEVIKSVLPDSPYVKVLFRENKREYFKAFAELMRSTDVLWTKPSELSFFAGLGIPIIMAPTIGSQEEYNRKWLLEVQAGIQQDDPHYAGEWLTDLLYAGRLAEAAWDGFLKARKCGSFKITEVLETGTMERETSPLRR
jgi:hypothetical protein